PNATYPVPTYTTGTTTEQANGWAFFTSNVLLALPDWSGGAGRKTILAVHGGNGNARTLDGTVNSSFGDYTRALVDAGFVMIALDLGASNNGNNITLGLLDQAFSYITAKTGASK